MKRMAGSKNQDQPAVISGGLAVDDRGLVSFANDFHFAGVKRFYLVENFSSDVIRAWHGHKKEAKYVLIVTGSAIIATVSLSGFTKPSKKLPISRFVLSAAKPSVLYIPPGHANGFRVLEKGTKIIFFSTATVEESKNDDFRFPYDYWGKKIWEVENR